MRKSLLAMTFLVAVTSPTLAADAQLEKLLVAVKKLDGKGRACGSTTHGHSGLNPGGLATAARRPPFFDK